MGPDEYGDAVLCKFGNKTILIDGAHPADAEGKGGHPSIPDQLGKLLDQEPPYRVSLLIVSHAHQDHIGCLPKLVQDDLLRPDWALIVDPELGWGRAGGEDRDFALIALTMKRWSASWSTRLRSKIVTTVCWIHLRRGERGSSVTGAIVAWR
ncbi:MAG: MBL fold metallo-hydrolase [Acidobacteria bacterium]|nr:MBL fold metallo-hydrolase [Acidobacteriota bacterium]